MCPSDFEAPDSADTTVVIDAIERGRADSDLTGPRASAGRILLVEHHAISQRLVAGMLAQLGFCVDVVVDGAEAVHAATRAEYQVILMDCQVPILDVCAATSDIRRLQGGTLHTPIIGVTLSVSDSDLQGTLAAGMDDHLTKPFNVATLYAVLTRWTADKSRCIFAGHPDSLAFGLHAVLDRPEPDHADHPPRYHLLPRREVRIGSGGVWLPSH